MHYVFCIHYYFLCMDMEMLETLGCYHSEFLQEMPLTILMFPFVGTPPGSKRLK
jgi:hypothetical protein